ncbi:hypothetical protein FB451DRAFT_1173669 [Mycena latifolia]|nr:hypothetical protein FB451DRAFT_1173669 [Mycena latifolia]
MTCSVKRKPSAPARSTAFGTQDDSHHIQTSIHDPAQLRLASSLCSGAARRSRNTPKPLFLQMSLCAARVVLEPKVPSTRCSDKIRQNGTSRRGRTTRNFAVFTLPASISSTILKTRGRAIGLFAFWRKVLGIVSPVTFYIHIRPRLNTWTPGLGVVLSEALQRDAVSRSRLQQDILNVQAAHWTRGSTCRSKAKIPQTDSVALDLIFP